MRKKTIVHKPPREKVYKLPSKPSTRSQDRTFTPSPSPPTSPPRTAPLARTKTTPMYPAPAKPMPPPKTTPSKPSSSKPGSSKGKRPAIAEPVPETAKPKSRSVPVRSQRGNPHRPLTSVKSKGNEGRPIDFDAGLDLLVNLDSASKENVSKDMLVQNFYDQPSTIERSKHYEENPMLLRRQLLVHPDINNWTVEEPNPERKKEQMGLDKPKVEDK
nr:alpha carbonic anhydrase 8-like [Arachis hypogaea]